MLLIELIAYLYGQLDSRDLSELDFYLARKKNTKFCIKQFWDTDKTLPGSFKFFCFELLFTTFYFSGTNLLFIYIPHYCFVLLPLYVA